MDHRTTLVGAALALVALAAVDLACGSDGAFFCTADEDCSADQGSGWCEVNGRCSFPDSECPSGRRYGAYAADLEQDCVEPDEIAEGSSDDGTMAETSASSFDDGATSADDGTEDSSPSSSDGAEGDDDSPPPPLRPECGDAIVQSDELCDDGNLDDSDACTQLCRPPTCDDALRSGDETDVDCGGSCEATCSAGASCSTDADCGFPLCADQVCVVVRDCAELLVLRPDTPSGEHLVQPDGSEPRLVYCDMTTDGGGWTRLVDEGFGDGADDAWSSGATSTCGDWGSYLGPFGNTTVSRGLDFALFPHDELLIRVDFFVMDSWDEGETIAVIVDDTQVFADQCNHGIAGSCGFGPHECRNSQWEDGRFATTIGIDNGNPTPALEFMGDLDQDIADESWGIAGLEVSVR